VNRTTRVETAYINILLKRGESWYGNVSMETISSIPDTDNYGYPMYPSWSPDGGKIIFEIDFAFYKENNGLWTISPDGTNLTQILHSNNGASYPSFSPDGSKILYLEDGVWIMNSDGTNRTILYANSSIDYDFGPPRFSPDGEKIVFVMAYNFSCCLSLFHPSLSFSSRKNISYSSTPSSKSL